MIKKLSDTWRQQKHRPTNNQDGNRRNQSKTHLGKNVASSLLRPSNGNYDDKAAPDEVMVSPPIKLKGDTMALGISSLDWGTSDSLIEQIKTPGGKLTEKEIQPSADSAKPRFTQLCKKTGISSILSPVGVTKSISQTSSPLPIVKQQPARKKETKQSVSHDKIKTSRQSSPILKDDEKLKSLDESLSLSNWSLPESVLAVYKEKGIEKMFSWQQECLLTGSVMEGGNLVYSAPTSAGKTLVAEILMLKRVLETKKKAVYILPFVSVAREKMYSLREQFEEAGVNVGGFMGSESPAGGFAAVDIAVCTIEKANSLVNRLMEEKKLSSLTCVVIDEMHMIGDPNRGYLLELLLTKVNFVASSTLSSDSQPIQLIGMSATLPNLDMLASWLNADLYFTDFRPVPLSERIKVGARLFEQDNKEVDKVKDLGPINGDNEGIIPLCVDTIKEGNSVLIFCPTKIWCEKLSNTIASYFSMNPHLLDKKSHCFKKASEVMQNNDESYFDAVLDQLRRSPVGLDETLEKVVKYGVAFHHAGLTYDERDILEGAFKRGVLRVLVATSTLSSGVNLPARRVIIRSPMFHGKLLDSLVYKQMVGRAGRKGVDTHGESILVCKNTEKQKALGLLNSHLKPVYSCLLGVSAGAKEFKSMKRALLEVIAAGVAVTPADVERYAQSTYLHTCLSVLEAYDAEGAIHCTMKFLLENEFISLWNAKHQQGVEDEAERYFSTQLGAATLASSLSPDEALVVFSELQKARKSFVLENELHVIYQITPIYLQDQWPDLDWYAYYNMWERLPAQSKYVGEVVGVQESFLARAVRNRIQTRTETQLQLLRLHRRFYAALVLQDLVNEVPLPVVSRRYKINRGLLQSLQNSSSTFAGMVTVFCQKLGWTCIELLLDQFQSRLSFGVSRELCNLVRIPLLNAFKARAFYDSGYQSVSALAYASKDDIAKILRDSVPFESKQSVKAKTSASRYIWLTGKEGLTEHEAAELIIAEAKRILNADAVALGIPMEHVATVTNTSLTYRRSSSGSSISSSSSKRKSSRSCINVSVKKKKKTHRKTSSPSVDGELKNNSNKENSCESNNSGGSKQNLRPLQAIDVTTIQPLTEVKSQRKSVDQLSDQEASFELLNGSDCLINSPSPSAHDNIAKNVSEENKTQLPIAERNNLTIPVESSEQGDESKRDMIDVSNDSMLFVPGNLLEPHVAKSTSPVDNKLTKNETSSDSLFDFSLRVSVSDELSAMEENFVPPMNLECEFDEASSQKRNSVKYGTRENKADNVFEAISLTDSLMISQELKVDEKTLLFTAASRTRDQKERSVVGHDEVLSGEFIIIDVASSKELFLTFLQEWKNQNCFSFCFACESIPKTSNTCIIGRKGKNEIRKPDTAVVRSGYVYENDEFRVVGVALCWGQKDAYYLNFEPNPPTQVELDDTSLPPAVCAELSLPLRVNKARAVFKENTTPAKIVSFDMKEQMKLLFECVDFLPPGDCIQDPKVANWMLNPDERQKNLHSLVKQFLSEDFIALAEAAGGGFGTCGLGLVPHSPGTGRVRACVEVVLCYHLMDVLWKRLIDENLSQPFLQIEMPSIRSLAVLEINGIGFSNSQCERLKDTMKAKLESIERECYQLANQTFSLTSTNDVARVLFYDLGLPPNGNVDAIVPPRQTRSKTGAKTKYLSTSKEILEKLVKYHRLPKLIIEWRRVNSALTKVVFPLQRKKATVASLEMDRIFSEAQYHTSTGRVTFTEPNIQNVPKEFNIKLPVFIGESPPIETKMSKKKRTHNKSLVSSTFRKKIAPDHDPNVDSPGEVFAVSMRGTFVAFDAAVLVAADYSQLELRLISHLSSDAKLIKVLNSSADVFKSVAAEIHRTSYDHVTPSQRQHAKQICYGIIYGMGPKALGEQLSLPEDEAAVYMQQFKDRYNGVKTYVKKTIENARKKGYVTTLSGRKRYLSAINSGNLQAKAQAERQAVNTVVQGSAADFVKNAMNAIDRKLTKTFGHSCLVKNTKCADQRGAFLVLQLHDELMYEVNRKDVETVKNIIRFEMEHSFELSVKMPVKMKLGTNWGNLKDL